MMASTCGPEMPFDLSLRGGQAFDHPTGGQFFEPTDLVAARFQPTESHMSRADAPPPNPPFTFPAKPTNSAGPSSSSRSRPAGRRPMSAVEPSSLRGPTAGADLEPRPRTTPLPAFSFNPGAGLSPDPTDPLDDPPPPPSPGPSQPPALPQTPSRPPGNRHRRGGSEFVGGSIRMGDSITVMSSSPTKSDGGFASSLGLPPASRRLHMRNKSANPTMGGSMDGAMPLQMVDGNIAPRVASTAATAATSTAAAASAPASPAGIEVDENAPPGGSTRTATKAEPRPSLAWLSEDSWPDSASPAESAVEPGVEKAAAKPKVGFSDTLEYIPRPLSIVSSDASSTTTLGPRHSLSGSISSIMSASNISILEERTASPTPSPTATPERSESRPSTAGAVLDRVVSQRDDAATDSSLKRRNSIPTIVTLTAAGLATSPAEHSPSKVPKRWAFFGLDQFVGTGSPTRSRPTSSGSIGSNPKTWSTSASSSCSVHVPDPESGEAAVDANQAPAAIPASVRAGKEARKKKKKAKKWTGSILTKKSKHRGHKKASVGAGAGAVAAPPIGRSIPILSEGDDEADGAVDFISQSAVDPGDDALPMPPILTVTGPTSSPDDVEISRPVSAPCADDDVSYQMIDLDAALGPFNTPLPRNPEWDAAQKAATHAKRKLHSAQGMKGFSGPGMHYHRRTESAPEMVPFEAQRNGLHRFASSSTMADVFEEDEEDESAPKVENASLAVPAGPAADSPPMSAANSISLPESEPESDGGDITPAVTVHTAAPCPDRPESTNSAGPESPSEPARALPIPTVKKERSTASLRAEIAELASTIVFRTSNLFADKGSDPDVAASRSRKLKNRSSRELLANVDISPLQIPSIHHQTPASPYPTSRASSFPSPRSPASYDAHIISTAPSSVNEDTNFQSLLLGEPGPEVRISVDDIPSLTSSHSTMTRDSFFGNNQAGFDTAASSRQRPLSLSSGPFGRRRSSLASLSRLISSSHGEPSKLSIEVTCENEEEPKKTSRTKRLSRLVQFWKPKEAKNGSGTGTGSATK